MGIFQSIDELSPFMTSVQCVLIDIPIGLKRHDETERHCDSLARSMLRPYRHASVFPAPSRCAVEINDYRQANAANRTCTGRGLSRQTFNIMRKIREVDSFLQKEPERHRIKEFHPELGFWALNNLRAMRFNKKTPDGLAERIAILSRYYPDTPHLFEKALQAYMRKQVARDDIVDALLCTLVAKQASTLVSLPHPPEIDEKGLPMQIVYWQPG